MRVWLRFVYSFIRASRQLISLRWLIITLFRKNQVSIVWIAYCLILASAVTKTSFSIWAWAINLFCLSGKKFQHIVG